MERLNAPKSGMTIMAQPNPIILPENAETAHLRAEIQRMADMVSVWSARPRSTASTPP